MPRDLNTEMSMLPGLQRRHASVRGGGGGGGVDSIPVSKYALHS
jgi:hypothetical protein